MVKVLSCDELVQKLCDQGKRLTDNLNKIKWLMDTSTEVPFMRINNFWIADGKLHFHPRTISSASINNDTKHLVLYKDLPLVNLEIVGEEEIEILRHEMKSKGWELELRLRKGFSDLFFFKLSGIKPAKLAPPHIRNYDYLNVKLN